MKFKDQLNAYIDQLGCTAKELGEASGVSAATISRYRSGERLPEADTPAFEALCRWPKRFCNARIWRPPTAPS